MKKASVHKRGMAFVLVLFLMVGCTLVEKSPEKIPVARVNDAYLYMEDIENLVAEGTPKADSTLIVSNFINRWATQQLLIAGAKLNLSKEKQKEFDELVENYKNQLYAKAYTDAIITRQLDTTVNMAEAENYYEENGENFKLNEDLVKLRYINLYKSNHDIEEVKERLIRFNEEDKQFLFDKAIQFKSYSFNDTVWVRTQEVYEKIPLLTPQNRNEFLRGQNFMQLEDSLEVYLIAVEEVRRRNEQAPLKYIMPTIEQILLNQRKLELITKLEKDITKDAIKNEKFEIYN